MFQTKVVQENKTHILCSVTLFGKSCRYNMEKYRRVGHATDGNMAHARCMLDTSGYKYTLRMCNNYWFSLYNKGSANAPQNCVLRTFTALLTRYVNFDLLILYFINSLPLKSPWRWWTFAETCRRGCVCRQLVILHLCVHLYIHNII